MERLFTGLDALLDSLSKPVLWTFTLVSIGLIGGVDYVTGTEAAFALFYLFPVAIAAWWIGVRAGIVCSIASSAAWHLANDPAGQEYASLFLSIWNVSIRLAIFLIVTLLLARLHGVLQREKLLSRIDHLTGVHNVRAFHEIAEAECLRVSRYPQPLTLAYVDVDKFKQVNDRYGHQEGDRVLRTVGQILLGSVRRPDTVARLGGDEFALLLPQTDTDNAQRFLPRLREDLLAAMHRNKWQVTFSVGAVTCPSAPATVGELVRQADQLMYEVKESGRDAIRFGIYQGPTRDDAADGDVLIPAQAPESPAAAVATTPAARG